jgi:hypothetical protein
MKTLINKNKIRLAGGLLVLLMTAILAVATAKSYAQNCWHVTSSKNPTNSIIPYVIGCCSCCSAMIPWSIVVQDDPEAHCVYGPDKNGYGFASCQTSPTGSKTIETGYTWLGGNCAYGCVHSGQCGCACNITWRQDVITSKTTTIKDEVALTGGMTCWPGESPN